MIDKATVAAKFAETGSKRETALALGISEEHVYGILRGLADRCVRCGVNVKSGTRQCQECQHFDRDRIRAKRLERSKLGLCQECGEPRSPLSKRLCEKHRQAQVERNRAHEAKKKRHSDLKPEAHVGRRLAAVRRRYGQEADMLWRQHDGCCQVCCARNGEKSIQIHHIDENRKNNSRANLAILCFDCHQATHKLLAVANFPAFLAWFRQTYAR